MAVDQDRSAEIPVHAREQAAQRPMVGFVQTLDPTQRIIDRDPLVVDLLCVPDHARDRAEAAGDALSSTVSTPSRKRPLAKQAAEV